MKTLLRNRRQFAVYLDEDLRRGLYQLAQRMRMSQSSIIRQLLLDAIRRELGGIGTKEAGGGGGDAGDDDAGDDRA